MTRNFLWWGGGGGGGGGGDLGLERLSCWSLLATN